MGAPSLDFETWNTAKHEMRRAPRPPDSGDLGEHKLNTRGDENILTEGIDKVRVALPYHLRNLAGVSGEVAVDVSGPVTIRSVLDALEARYPMLRGTIREYETGQRRAFLRFFACAQDWSLASVDDLLPDAVASGREPFLVIGAIAGG